jgi:hypothetical protein
MPEYPGGIQAFYQYLEDNINWPEEIYVYLYQMRSREHKVRVSFVIEKDGSLGDISLVKDLGLASLEEITRVLKACPKWKPGIQDGKKIRVKFALPIDIPPPAVSEIRIDEPVGTRSYPLAVSKESAPLPPILAANGKYTFRERLNNCKSDSFNIEEGIVALSDRFSVLHYVKESIPRDSLKNLTGRIALQLVIDTAGVPCLFTYQNNLNTAFNSLYFDEALTGKTKWRLKSFATGEKMAVSIILAFTFTSDKIIYQHLASKYTSGSLAELERSEIGKFRRY